MKQSNLPCYLETAKRENVNIYEHIGFKVMEEYHNSEHNLDVFSMLWKP